MPDQSVKSFDAPEPAAVAITDDFKVRLRVPDVLIEMTPEGALNLGKELVDKGHAAAVAKAGVER